MYSHISEKKMPTSLVWLSVTTKISTKPVFHFFFFLRGETPELLMIYTAPFFTTHVTDFLNLAKMLTLVCITTGYSTPTARH